MFGVLLFVNSIGTLTLGDPNSETDNDHLVKNQPSPAPSPERKQFEISNYLLKACQFSWIIYARVYMGEQSFNPTIP